MFEGRVCHRLETLNGQGGLLSFDTSSLLTAQHLFAFFLDALAFGYIRAYAGQADCLAGAVTQYLAFFFNPADSVVGAHDAVFNLMLGAWLDVAGE